MTEVVDKALLIVVGIILVSSAAVSPEAVVAMLLGVIAAALGICVDDKRICVGYILLFMVTCFFLPELLFFLPIIFYDCAMKEMGFYYYISVPVLFFFHYQEAGELSIKSLAIWSVLCAIGAVLGLRTGSKLRLEKEMITLRDSSTELNLVLREKNKHLLEKQDYEIHLATLHERNRIAREIHDNVGHMLSRSILQMGALMTIHKEEPLHGQLESVNETLNLAMNNIRESVHDLHDEAIDLRQAILEATREMSKKYQLTLDYDMSSDIPRDVKYCFIAIVKEAMSNIVKHADADKVTIILREQPGFYQLTVEDNGSATSVKRAMDEGHGELSGGGIGLSNMRERVEALNGIFRIHRDKGFRIFISIPKEQEK